MSELNEIFWERVRNYKPATLEEYQSWAQTAEKLEHVWTEVKDIREQLNKQRDEMVELDAVSLHVDRMIVMAEGVLSMGFLLHTHSHLVSKEYRDALDEAINFGKILDIVVQTFTIDPDEPKM